MSTVLTVLLPDWLTAATCLINETGWNTKFFSQVTVEHPRCCSGFSPMDSTSSSGLKRTFKGL